MQFPQQVNGLTINRVLVFRTVIEMFTHPQIAEILQKDQAVRQVASKNLRSGKAGVFQIFGDGDKGFGIFVRRRRIHQNRMAISCLDAKVAPE